MCADFLRDQPLMAAAVGGVPLVLAIMFYCLMAGSGSGEKKSKKKKKNKEKKDK